MFVVLLILLILVSVLGTAEADFTFGEPVNLGAPANSSNSEGVPSISSDGLELYYDSMRSGGSGYVDLWVCTRETTAHDWRAPVNLGSVVNTSSGDNAPYISASGLELYFASNRPGGHGQYDLWVTKRTSKADPWQEPENLGPTINGSSTEWRPSISADGTQLYFSSDRPGGQGGGDLVVATRLSTEDKWGIPVNLGSNVNGPHEDADPGISPNGLHLFFRSNRPGGQGGWDLWVTRRKTTGDDWEPAVNLEAPVNSPNAESCPSISADGTSLYFCDWGDPQPRPGGYGSWDMWKAPVISIVDLNGDGVVDASDMSIMVHYWGQSEPLCDIGPTPLGDGVVDSHDLVVLAEHFGPGLEAVAHWRLDEGAGTVAHDSIGGNDATVMGGAVWQPEDGVIDGALELDGVDDHVATDFVSDPKAGPVRVACWVKTDVAGGVIVSQTPGAGFGSTWLATDAADGTLMSEMMFPLPALHSTVIVTDGQWHEVTAEWDGTYRCLWADNQEVARDALPVALPPLSWNGTFIVGAGANLEVGTFFSGLIDDVRIYNRAVMP
jgi:Tol biopolymer transport system component